MFLPYIRRTCRSKDNINSPKYAKTHSILYVETGAEEKSKVCYVHALLWSVNS